MILVEDGQIRAVDFAGLVCPSDVPLLDLGELTMLPGLCGCASVLGSPPVYPQALASYPAEVAHRVGLSVTAHATTGVAEVLTACVDGIEHCTFRSENDVFASLM
ncbi:hypothetical protein [Mycobacterium lepromatosis]|uniref:hypothetical protein n=1 Tax=Mycobacterium lepromatosis TaxID=480418 RepID=UPI0006785E85|nr:hypothetical protein [Mycobacterium lepromatosis]